MVVLTPFRAREGVVVAAVFDGVVEREHGDDVAYAVVAVEVDVVNATDGTLEHVASSLSNRLMTATPP